MRVAAATIPPAAEAAHRMRDARTSRLWRRRVLLALVVLAIAVVALAALAWRPEIAPIDPPRARRLRDAADRARRAPGQRRQLHRLPRQPGRPRLRRRPRPRHALRHDLLDQHHARCRDRHRPLVAGGLRPCHARGRRPARGAPLPGLPLHPLHPGQRRGPARALRLPDDARAGARAGARERARLPARLPALARGLEDALLPPATPSGPTRRRAASGTAAPTSWKASRTAAPATRRATPSVPSGATST